jgi:hypothetical protein
MQKHLLVSMSDLRHASLVCPCGVKLTIDLRGYQGMALKSCSVCGKDHDPRAVQDIAALAKIYGNANPASGDPAPSKYRIDFWIPAE